MDQPSVTAPPRYRALGRQHLDRLPHLQGLSNDQRLALEAVSAVLPFRVNSYVLDELIDWDDIPNDPIYQLTFPQAGMLESPDFTRLVDQVVRQDQEGLTRVARSIQHRMNPHPSGQLRLNVPTVDGEPLPGAQHKYRETILFFPSQGQTCHAYCTYCFRWAQFVGIQDFRFANREASTLQRYVEAHRELTDVLFTGGDPLVMSTQVLRRYVEPLLTDANQHISSIRLGTKSLAYWPHRFLTDPDADDLLRLFEEVRASGRQLALMAHFSHPRELETPTVQAAMRRIVDTGAVIRCQAPLIRHVNDDADAWARMWNLQVRLGAIPYYLFVERDTGPRHYFEVPLARALKIFSAAYGQVSGLARTVRGPSMSATPGKVLVDGVTELDGEKVFALKFIQARETSWVNRIFFARFDSQAAWLSELEPVGGQTEFFFDRPIRLMEAGQWQPEWRLATDDEELASA
jgi:KamA family protein